MDRPNLSHRATKTPPSPIRKLAGLAEQAAKRGLHVYRLNIGQPDLPSPQEFLDGVRSVLKPVVAYEASQGSTTLLQAWCAYLNRSYPSVAITPQEMLITMGASEALIFAFMVCCDPGDEILIFDPTYANYIGFSAIAGVRLVPLPCPLDRGVLPSRGEIERFISPYTRAVLVCNPNNPTGAVCSDAELQMLISLCRERGLFLVVDETYREFVYDEVTPRCIFELAPRDPHIVVVDSLSKRFSLCGARIGCLMTWHPELMQSAFHIAQARLAAPSIEQDAAAHMLSCIDARYVTQTFNEYRSRRDAAVAALSTIPGVTAFSPKGGFYLLAELPVEDAEDFASYMLTDFSHAGATTFVAPAAGFFMHREMGRRAIRIAFVLNSGDMQRAIEVLSVGVDAYKKTKAR